MIIAKNITLGGRFHGYGYIKRLAEIQINNILLVLVAGYMVFVKADGVFEAVIRRNSAVQSNIMWLKRHIGRRNIIFMAVHAKRTYFKTREERQE